MASENPYESPRSQNSDGVQSETPSIGFRCLRALILGTIGFSAYAVAQTAALPSRDWYVNIFHPFYQIGFIVAAALAGSELLFIRVWSLDQSTLRRVILSALLMFPACIVGGKVSDSVAPPSRQIIGDFNFGLFVVLSVVVHFVVVLGVGILTSRLLCGSSADVKHDTDGKQKTENSKLN